MLIGCGRNRLVLPNLEKDKGHNKDNDDRDTSSDDDRQETRVSLAFFGGGITFCRLLFAHERLDAKAGVRG